MRLADDNRSVNFREEESRASSRCMLKSIVIMNSCGLVAAEDRKVWNSSRKTLMCCVYLDDVAGDRCFKR